MKTIKTHRILTIVYLAAMAFVCHSASAQFKGTDKYFPKGTTWEELIYAEESGGGWDHLYAHYRYTVEGSIVYNDTIYKLVNAEMIDSIITPSSLHLPQKFQINIVEDGDSIYSGYHELIYDFDWKEGKTICIQKNGYPKYVIHGIKQMTLKDEETYDYLEQPLEKGENAYVDWMYPKGEVLEIKGIGRVNWGVFDYFGFYYKMTGNSVKHKLLNFSRNDILIYSSPKPEPPTTAINEVHQGSSHSTTATYTLMGTKVDNRQSLPAGIYISNGRKMVTK